MNIIEVNTLIDLIGYLILFIISFVCHIFIASAFIEVIMIEPFSYVWFPIGTYFIFATLFAGLTTVNVRYHKKGR